MHNKNIIMKISRARGQYKNQTIIKQNQTRENHVKQI